MPALQSLPDRWLPDTIPYKPTIVPAGIDSVDRIIVKGVLAGIAPGGDVVNGSRILDSQRPGHEQLPQSANGIQDTRPDTPLLPQRSEQAYLNEPKCQNLPNSYDRQIP